MSEIRYKLSKSIKICKKKHFEYLFQDAKRVQNSYLKVYFIKAYEEKGKVAFIASKFLGNAVKRNAFKRRLREIYRLNQHKIVQEYDLALFAKQRLLEKDFVFIEREFIKLLTQYNLCI